MHVHYSRAPVGLLKHLLDDFDKRSTELALRITTLGKVVYAYKIVRGQAYIPCGFCDSGWHRHGWGRTETPCYRVSHCHIQRDSLADALKGCTFPRLMEIRTGNSTRYMDHVDDPDLKKLKAPSASQWQRPSGEIVTLSDSGSDLTAEHGLRAVKICSRMYFTDLWFFHSDNRDDVPCYIYGQVDQTNSRIHWHGTAVGKLAFLEEWHRIGAQENVVNGEKSRSSTSDSEVDSDSEPNFPILARDACFLPETLIEASTGEFLRADRVQANQTVRGADGSILTVTFVHLLPERERDSIALYTEGAPPLVVTADHRIVVFGSDGQTDRLANELDVGVEVLCSDLRPHRLIRVDKIRLKTAVVSLKFQPDLPVAVQILPFACILAKGQHKRAIRRSQKHRRDRARSLESTPDWHTLGEYSD